MSEPLKWGVFSKGDTRHALDDVQGAMYDTEEQANKELASEFDSEDYVVAEIDRECEECDGSGVVDCPHCGREMDCEECDGTGETY